MYIQTGNICIYIYIYLYIYINMCTYIYIPYEYIYMYINIYLCLRNRKSFRLYSSPNRPAKEPLDSRQAGQPVEALHTPKKSEQTSEMPPCRGKIYVQLTHAAFRAHMQNETHTHAFRDQTHTSQTYARICHQFC